MNKSFFPWSTLSTDEHRRAAKLWFDIKRRDDAFRIFIDTMILSEIASIGPLSESDAHENVAQQLFARIVKRCGGGHRGRDEAERIFQKMAKLPKRKILTSRSQLLRKIYNREVRQHGVQLLTLAKAIHNKNPGEYGPTVGAIYQQFRRFHKKDGTPRLRRGRRKRIRPT